jgi:hypothetical protein
MNDLPPPYPGIGFVGGNNYPNQLPPNYNPGAYPNLFIAIYSLS